MRTATEINRRPCSLIILIVLAVAASLIAVGAPAASAASGGSTYTPGDHTGSAQPGTAVPKKAVPQQRAKKPQRRSGRVTQRAVISGFKLISTTLFDGGRPLKVKYRIKGSAHRVRTKLVVRTAGGKYVRTIQLGAHRTRVLQVTTLSQLQLGTAKTGRYKLRLTAVDRHGHRAVLAAKVQPWLKFAVADHRFPVVGNFTFGGAGSRFGVGRPGHIHQGQDVAAAEGTPVVAPFGGLISWVKYQASAAGWYVVLHANDGRDYVFMHLKAGSIAVQQGDTVATGTALGQVGSTGDASGPHLHFEVWAGGPWQFGGHPIDPLPLLQAWYVTAPAGALLTS